MPRLTLAIAFLFTISTVYAQQPDTLWARLLKENTLLLQPSPAGFTGKGWDLIQAGVKDNQYVLIGEDHFMAEIPYFTEQVMKTTLFNTFALEVDPYIARILTQKLAQTDTASVKKWAVQAGPALSFYSLQEEFHMLQEASRRHTALIGLDQVMMMSDQLLYDELAHKATRPRVRQRYADMSERATLSAMKAAADLNHPMYMQSAVFADDVATLAKEPMTPYEKEILNDIQLSARIYKTQSHALRVQLMKHQLMAAYASAIKDKKVLVKLGAMHCARGESYLTVYDCGNLLNNLAESEFKSSYHIAIFGKNGIQGSPFKALPERPLDPVNGELKFLKPFLDATPSDSWVVFNLLPFRKALQKQTIKVDDIDLRRTILGYDTLVIFPTAHPSHSMK